ncbi:class I SAM-dependent methyltransferase [Bailinhaonella thermotolerans]|uniref:Class I SAM-dependent methyltransferase n=1 Tax=Bailinhaonella thermotolerans TaxID=1070861 RepID=A0A3A4A9M8_9ACTN|nr:class I SAM-dependent methyltransferase [Bailinhaonella thermotolerans]RJL23024.1 class I SAM-dependent methyltransferase [Bailinhaonella thermotolerans]
MSGIGPGAIAPDGSPVDFYRRLTADDEPRVIGSVVPRGGSLLELGCGTGRVTRALLEMGHPVVAVDESADMLAAVPSPAEPVRARIQDLDLGGRRFDGVLLCSFLLNTPDDDLRHAFLGACARHVAPGGSVIVQWQPAAAIDAWRVGPVRTTPAGVAISMTRVERPAPDLAAATMRYETPEHTWEQSFVSRRLTDADLAAELAAAGLALDRFLTGDRLWFRAVPR